MANADPPKLAFALDAKGIPRPAFRWRDEYAAGNRIAELAEAVEIELDGYKPIVVPVGFITDFSSVPRILSWFIAPNDRGFAEAGIVHDWLYRHGPYSQANADLIFRELLIKWGAPPRRAWLAYFSLRVFGWRNFTTKNYKG